MPVEYGTHQYSATKNELSQTERFIKIQKFPYIRFEIIMYLAHGKAW